MADFIRDAVSALLESDNDRNYYNPATGELVMPDFTYDDYGNAKLNGFMTAEVPFREAYLEMATAGYTDVGSYAADAISAPGTGAHRRMGLIEPRGFLFGELVDRVVSQDGWGYGDRDQLEAYAQTEAGARALSGPTLYQRLVEANVVEEHPEWVNSHESDLYLVDNEVTRPIVEQWCRDNGYNMEHQATRFTDQVTGERTFDVFAAYDPYWESRLSGTDTDDIAPPNRPTAPGRVEKTDDWVPVGPGGYSGGAMCVARAGGELAFIGIAMKGEDGTWFAQEYQVLPDRGGRICEFEPVYGYANMVDAMNAIDRAEREHLETWNTAPATPTPSARATGRADEMMPRSLDFDPIGEDAAGREQWAACAAGYDMLIYAREDGTYGWYVNDGSRAEYDNHVCESFDAAYSELSHHMCTSVGLMPWEAAEQEKRHGMQMAPRKDASPASVRADETEMRSTTKDAPGREPEMARAKAPRQ